MSWVCKLEWSLTKATVVLRLREAAVEFLWWGGGWWDLPSNFYVQPNNWGCVTLCCCWGCENLMILINLLPKDKYYHWNGWFLQRKNIVATFVSLSKYWQCVESETNKGKLTLPCPSQSCHSMFYLQLWRTGTYKNIFLASSSVFFFQSKIVLIDLSLWQ